MGLNNAMLEELRAQGAAPLDRFYVRPAGANQESPWWRPAGGRPGDARREITIRYATRAEVQPRWFAVLQHVEAPIELLLATDQDAVVVGEAYFAFASETRSLYILSLDVISEMRSLGIGTALMEAAERIALQVSRPRLYYAVVDVERQNVRARALFERRGYVGGFFGGNRTGYVQNPGDRGVVDVTFAGPPNLRERTPIPALVRTKTLMFLDLQRRGD